MRGSAILFRDLQAQFLAWPEIWPQTVTELSGTVRLWTAIAAASSNITAIYVAPVPAGSDVDETTRTLVAVLYKSSPDLFVYAAPLDTVRAFRESHDAYLNGEGPAPSLGKWVNQNLVPLNFVRIEGWCRT